MSSIFGECREELENWVSGLVTALDDEGLKLHSLAVGTGDTLAVERYWWPCRPDLAQSTHSITKSFVSMATGLLVASGKLSWDTTVGDIWGTLPTSAKRLADASIEDLLTMRSGHSRAIGGDQLRGLSGSWIDGYFQLELSGEPGRNFLYNSGTSHLVSALLQRVSGQSVSELLENEVFRPLGFAGHSWQSDPEGISAGGNGLSLRLRDLWKWGHLCLCDGKYRGARLLPEGWVARATRRHVSFGESSQADNPWKDGVATGFGHHIWCGPRGAFFAEGKFGQGCIIVPELDLVIAFTSSLSTRDHFRLEHQIFKALPPASTRPGGSNPPGAYVSFADPTFADAAPILPKWHGGPVPAGLWRCDANPLGLEWVELKPETDHLTVVLTDPRGRHPVKCGISDWCEGRTNMPFSYLHHSYQPTDTTVIAAVRRLAANAFRLDWAFPETPFRDTVRLRFDAEGCLHWNHSTNVNSGEVSYSTTCRPMSGPTALLDV